jgi:RNA polymerase sigma factor (sigma-70 family)
MNYLDDRALIAGCVSGSRDALEGFVRRFSDPVYRSIQYTLNAKNTRYSREDLEDLHNTVFLGILENQCRKLRQYKGENGCSLATWIRLITVRVVIDHMRKTGVDALGGHKMKVPMDILDSFKSDGPDPLDDMERARQWKLIQEGMKALIPRDRFFLTLYCQEQYSVREIAGLMNLSEENAHSIKHRAIKRLKESIFKGSRRQGVEGSSA